MSIYSRFGLLKIKIDKDKCINCNKCDRSCQMSVDIEKYINNENTKSIKDGNCIVCGDCIDGCPTDALCFGLGNK